MDTIFMDSENSRTSKYQVLVLKLTNKLDLRRGLSKINKDKICENVPHLEVVDVVLVHCNLVYNDYQQNSRILYTFVPNKAFGSLLEISPPNHVFLKTFTSFKSFKKSKYDLQIKEVNH